MTHAAGLLWLKGRASTKLVKWSTLPLHLLCICFFLYIYTLYWGESHPPLICAAQQCENETDNKNKIIPLQGERTDHVLPHRGPLHEAYQPLPVRKEWWKKWCTIPSKGEKTNHVLPHDGPLHETYQPLPLTDMVSKKRKKKTEDILDRGRRGAMCYRTGPSSTGPISPSLPEWKTTYK